MLFSKRKTSSDDSGADAGPGTAEKLERLAASERFHRELNDDALDWLKAFALHESDLDTSTFYRELEDLRTLLRAPQDGTPSSREMRKRVGFIPAFIGRQHDYLKERDEELRDVVSTLTRALVEMNARNEAYDSSAREQIDTMTSLTRLEDIRRIKTGLMSELTTLRSTLERKREADASGLQTLKGQVEVLRNELEQAQEESRRDGLTGIYNRRAFDWFLKSLLDGQGRRRNKFAVMMLDLDDFKGVNDTFGHPLGDRVLMALVHTCQDVIRSEDFFARIGGDEFALVFPGASARIAARKGAEICESLNRQLFTTEETDEEPAVSLTLSISVGVTERQKDDDLTALLRRVDEALYQAKRDGKNCVRVR